MQHSERSTRPLARTPRLATGVGALAISFSALACSSDPISIGAAPMPNEAPEPELACGDGAIGGAITATTQEHIDALAGCEIVPADLWISTFPGMDLRPLGALRVVEGALVIGPSLQSSLDDTAAPIESLAGLEALERASAISLVGVSAPDLSALANLTSLRPDRNRWPQRWPQAGYLVITSSEGLRSLTGLERLREWDSLMLQSNPNLETLAGLQAPPYLASIDIVDHPRLRDLTALASVREVDEFNLVASQVESLDGLQLDSVRSLSLRDNPGLVQIEGLSTLHLAQIVRVENNDSLRQMPELRLLASIEELVINGNASLRSIPAYDGATVELRRVDINNNAALVEATVPVGNTSARQLAINNNPLLARLNLASFINVDSLTIRDNPALRDVAIGALSTVDVLELVDNPALSVAPFAEVRTFESTITGNLDSPAP